MFLLRFGVFLSYTTADDLLLSIIPIILRLIAEHFAMFVGFPVCMKDYAVKLNVMNFN